jgi:hypothetical protein
MPLFARRRSSAVGGMSSTARVFSIRFPSGNLATRESVGDVLLVAGRDAPVSHASLQTRQSGDKNAF